MENHEQNEYPEGYGPDGRDVETTAVVFRVWKKDPQKGEVIALFPAICDSYSQPFCMSYMHVGQHGSANYYGVIEMTRPAKPEEYADLQAELEQPWPGFGYRLKVYQRETVGMRRERQAQFAAIRAQHST